MSCNGCRVLRKGCSESCILRPCLQWINTPESQAHATLFVAKFFGRAGLMSFISNVPSSHRPALFQSLLYEACGRTVNPVSGAVGLLWTGNWHVCQAAVDTVLRGGTLLPIPDFLSGAPPSPPTADTDDASDVLCPPQYSFQKQIQPGLAQDLNSTTSNSHHSPLPRFTNTKRRRCGDDCYHESQRKGQPDLLTPSVFPHAPPHLLRCLPSDKQPPGTPSLNSEESATTISFESAGLDHYDNNHQIQAETRLLNLFV